MYENDERLLAYPSVLTFYFCLAEGRDLQMSPESWQETSRENRMSRMPFFRRLYLGCWDQICPIWWRLFMMMRISIAGIKLWWTKLSGSWIILALNITFIFLCCTFHLFPVIFLPCPLHIDILHYFPGLIPSYRTHSLSNHAQTLRPVCSVCPCLSFLQLHL